MEPKKREFTFSLESITDRIVLLVVLGILGGPGIISMVVPGARPDAFTGTQGAELIGRIDLLEQTIEQIMDDDKGCEDRQIQIMREYKMLYNLVVTYQATTKERDNNQEKMIEDLRRWRMQ